jgi:hypothetical protein
MSSTVAGKESDLAPFQFTEHERVRRLAERRINAFFVDVGESGH